MLVLPVLYSQSLESSVYCYRHRNLITIASTYIPPSVASLLERMKHISDPGAESNISKQLKPSRLEMDF